MASSVKVLLKPRCFAKFVVAGTEVELFTEKVTSEGAAIAIRSAKKIGALRVYQELPGFDDATPAAAGGTLPIGKSKSA